MGFNSGFKGLKILDNGQCPLPQTKTVPVNFPCAVLSILDFVTLENGTYSKMLAWNYHSTLCSDSEGRRSHTILQRRPWFGSAWSGSEQAGLVCPVRHFTHKFKMTSHFSAKFKGKTSSCIQVNKAH